MGDEPTARELREAAREHAEEARRLEASTQRLGEIADRLDRNMGKMILSGLVRSVTLLPLTGLVIYVAVRLALRRGSPARR